MTKEVKVAIDNMPTISYWSANGGIEVKDIYEKDGETRIRCISNAWCGHHRYHDLKVLYTTPKIKESRAYVLIHGVRYYMDECLRT